MAAVNLNTFPNNRVSALTMLYLGAQDLTELTPEELATRYDEVFDKINSQFKEERRERAENKTK
ncbi:MAG: hypothetical protein ACOH15_11320 [Acetobacterium sp.]